MDPHSRAAKKITSHGNEVLPQDTTHLTQRPSYLTIVKICELKRCEHVSRSSGLAETILQGTVKVGKKRKQTAKEVGRQHQEMDRSGVRQVPEGSGEQRRMMETGCEVICGAPTTLAAKG